MALRLRRGTDAQRLLITPAEGEIIYTTDTKRLWVGDGVTQGGNLVNTGAVYGLDDLVDVDLTLPPIAGDVLKYDGEKFVAAGEAPFTPGGDYYINIISDDDTVLLDSFLGVHRGIFEGDLSGSVFSDDSTLLVDGINNILSNGTISIADNSILSANGSIKIGKIDGGAVGPALEVNHPGNLSGLVVNSTSNGFQGPNIILTATSGDNLDVVPLSVGDTAGNIRFRGLLETPGGPITIPLGVINVVLTEESDGISTAPKAEMELFIPYGPNESLYKKVIIDSDGTVIAPSIKTGLLLSDTGEVLVNTETGTHRGLFQGALQGRIIGTDSTVYFDNFNNLLSNGVINIIGDVITSDIGTVTIDGSNSIGTGPALKVEHLVNRIGIRVDSVSSGFTGPNIVLNAVSSDTLDIIPLSVGDTTGNIRFAGLLNTPGGELNVPLGVINVIVAEESDGISTAPKGQMEFLMPYGPNQNLYKKATLDVDGVFTSPVIKTGSYATVDLPTNPTAGSIVFDSTSNEFKGWNGTAWVVLG